MNDSRNERVDEMKSTMERRLASKIAGYDYGTEAAARSPLSMAQWEQLKESAGFTSDDEQYLKMAGEVLADQTKALVDTWRSAIAKTPHLARHSKDPAKDPDGKPIPRYAENGGLRFQQWILDTCFRTYDQNWLNYQQEIALRHTAIKKNTTDGVESTSYIPLRDIIAFAAVINDTVRRFLAAKGRTADEVQKMHTAWCKSVQLQIALWAEPNTNTKLGPDQW